MSDTEKHINKLRREALEAAAKALRTCAEVIERAAKALTDGES